MLVSGPGSTEPGSAVPPAAADDTEQASSVSGKVQVCARTAACPASVHWLVPAGPGYGALPPVSPGQLLADLNRYWTDCTGAAGAAGHADLAFRFPFAKGVTEILLNPHTYAFAGYASGPAQTLMTQQAVVSGPGVLP